MKRFHVKMAVFAAVLIACVTVVLSAAEPDAYTPQTFLYERYSRLSADYMLAVLGRGDAATLTPALRTIHAEINAGSHNTELDVIEVNLTTLISTAEDLIRSQESPDKVAYTEAEIPARIQSTRSDLESGFNEAPGAQISSKEEIEYVPPDYDKIYNEAKKDLLDEAYDMLDDLQLRKK